MMSETNEYDLKYYIENANEPIFFGITLDEALNHYKKLSNLDEPEKPVKPVYENINDDAPKSKKIKTINSNANKKSNYENEVKMYKGMVNEHDNYTKMIKKFDFVIDVLNKNNNVGVVELVNMLNIIDKLDIYKIPIIMIAKYWKYWEHLKKNKYSFDFAIETSVVKKWKEETENVNALLLSIQNAVDINNANTLENCVDLIEKKIANIKTIISSVTELIKHLKDDINKIDEDELIKQLDDDLNKVTIGAEKYTQITKYRMSFFKVLLKHLVDNSVATNVGIDVDKYIDIMEKLRDRIGAIELIMRDVTNLKKLLRKINLSDIHVITLAKIGYLIACCSSYILRAEKNDNVLFYSFKNDKLKCTINIAKTLFGGINFSIKNFDAQNEFENKYDIGFRLGATVSLFDVFCYTKDKYQDEYDGYDAYEYGITNIPKILNELIKYMIAESKSHKPTIPRKSKYLKYKYKYLKYKYKFLKLKTENNLNN